MKRTLTLFFSLCLIFSSTITSDAKSPDDFTADYIEYINEEKSPDDFTADYIEYINEDLYAEIEVSVALPGKHITFSTDNSLYHSAAAKNSTKQRTAAKTYKIKNTFGTVVATYTLTGTFQYNGSSSSCIAASCSTSVSFYYFSSKSAKKSGNTATSSFTLSSSLQTVSKTLTLTCTSNGTIQ